MTPDHTTKHSMVSTSRLSRPLFLLVVSASLAVLVYGIVASDLFAHAWNPYERGGVLRLAIGVAACCAFGIVVRSWRTAWFAGLALLALGLAGAAASTGVLLILAACYVIGDWALKKLLGLLLRTESAPADAVLATILGAAIALFLMAVFARVRIHY